MTRVQKYALQMSRWGMQEESSPYYYLAAQITDDLFRDLIQVIHNIPESFDPLSDRDLAMITLSVHLLRLKNAKLGR